MQDSRPDTVQELVRILREQIDRKDERIASLEALLQQTNQQVVEQQRILTAALCRQFDRNLSEPPSISAFQAVEPASVALPEQKQQSGEFTPAISHGAIDNRVKLPDLGPQIEVIANAVVAAGARKAGILDADESELHDTAKLLATQAPAAKPSRGLRFWKRRERVNNHA